GNPPATSYHQGVVSGTCANCHVYTGVNGSTHNNGTVDLIAGGGVCNSCHGYPPAPRQTESGTPVFGTQGQYSSARFEDYSGGGGAHLAAGHLNPNIRPSDGWTPCLTCHTGGSASHRMKLPIQNHISSVTIKVDPQYKFNDSVLIAYTGAKQVNPPSINKTGSCYNASCHFQPSQRWSIER